MYNSVSKKYKKNGKSRNIKKGIMMKKEVRKDIFEVHKPSALITAEYKTPITVRGRIKGYEHYTLTPIQHDAMNYMCYKAREQIHRSIDVEKTLKSFDSEDELFKFLEVQKFDLDLNELSLFAEKYTFKQDKKELSSILDSLRAVQVKVGIFKQDKVLGKIHAIKTMSLLRNYTRITNSNKATFQLEPEILMGWIYKTTPFSKMFLKVQTKLKLTYSKILYEICKDYQNQKIIVKPFNEWLIVLGFDRTKVATKTVGQLKQAYLNKAIKEINTNTDIFITSIEGKKFEGNVTMTVTFKKQDCELIDTSEQTIDSIPFYQKSKAKLDAMVKKGYKVIDEEMWIQTDIKKNEEKYDAETRIDAWLNETTQDVKNAIFENLANSLGCNEHTVYIKDYLICGIFSNDLFTKSAKESLEKINVSIRQLDETGDLTIVK